MSNNDNNFNSSSLKENIRKYEEAIKLGKSPYFDADTFVDIIEYYNSKKQTERADNCIQLALQIHTDNANLKTLLAHRFIDSNNLAGAKEIDDNLEKNEVEQIILHGEILVIEMEIDEAEEFFKASSEKILDEDKINLINEIAGLYLDYDYPQRALNWIQKIAKEDYDVICKQIEAECYIDLGDFEKATSILNAILDKDPYDIQSWGLLSEAQFISGQHQEALQSCDFALAINENNELTLKTKAGCLYELHQYSEAQKAYEKYNSLEDNDNLSILFEAICHNQIGNYDKALALLKKAGMLYQQDSLHLQLIYTQLADSYSKLGKVDDAKEYVDKAAHLGLDQIKANLLKADILLENNMNIEGLKIISKQMHLQNNDEETYLKIAILMSKHGYYSSAQVILKELVDYPGVDKSCYAYMAYVSKQMNDQNNYLFYLDKASREAPLETKDLFKNDFEGIEPDKYAIEARKRLETPRDNHDSAKNQN